MTDTTDDICTMYLQYIYFSHVHNSRWCPYNLTTTLMDRLRSSRELNGEACVGTSTSAILVQLSIYYTASYIQDKAIQKITLKIMKALCVRIMNKSLKFIWKVPVFSNLLVFFFLSKNCHFDNWKCQELPSAFRSSVIMQKQVEEMLTCQIYSGPNYSYKDQPRV